MKIFKSFDKDIKFRRLFLYWVAFFIIGVFLMILITPTHPSFIESESEFTESFCEPWSLVFIILAPLTELLIFMLIPYLIFKKKGLVVGIIIWALLHLLTRDFPVFFYILIIGYFYYRCLEIGKWKEVILFHFVVNIPGVILCFM